jgi:multiple sugar transport system ATP-binding protein
VQLPARILAVEPLGAETLLVLATKTGNEELIARIGRETLLRSGGEVMIVLDTAAIHLFDRDTGKAIAEPA